MLIVRVITQLDGGILTLVTRSEPIAYSNDCGDGNIASANERIILAIGYLM